jgi:hypothetical protein
LRLLERGEDARACLDEHDLRAARIDVAEVGREREASELGDGACELDPGRPGADDDEAQQPIAVRRVGLHLRRFECAEDSPPDLRRVVDRLQSGRVRTPVVVAEVRMRRARRDDEVIERQRATPNLDDAARRVDTRDFTEQHRRVALPAEDPADRPRDIRRRQARGGDLIEQRLEQVVVVPVDDRDVRGCARERLRGEQAAEPCPDDDDASARHSIEPLPIGRSGTRFSSCQTRGDRPPRRAKGGMCLATTQRFPRHVRRGF